MQAHAFGIMVVVSATLMTQTSATWTYYEGATVTLALVNYTYRDPRRDGVLVEVGQVGKYAPGQVSSASGKVVVGRTKMAAGVNEVKGEICHFPWSPPAPAPAGPWVALIGRGMCPDSEKVAAASASNASAIILFSSDPHAHLRKLALDQPELPVVWLGEEEGRGLAGVVEGGAEVVISLAPGQQLRYHVTSVNRRSLGERFVLANPLCEPRMFPADCFIVTSVLFVSVSFIILMAISLAWLVFYYVQRFRYIHAKDRLARHLCNAAKKALAKIPVKTLKAADREVTLEGECCAVCIELYQVGEAVRTLPCKHQFHRCCVDPWLLEHRTCPMCKMDILKHYGYVFSGSTETVLPVEDEGIEFELRSLSESEESVVQLDMVEAGEVVQGGGSLRGHPAVDTVIPLPLAPHSPRTAPHLTHVPRSDVGGWRDGMVMGLPVPDVPISPIHTPSSPTPPASLLTLLSPSSKSLSPSLPSSSTLGKKSPPPSSSPAPRLLQTGGMQDLPQPHHTTTTTTTSEETVMDLELSSVSSGEVSLGTRHTATPPHSPVGGRPSSAISPDSVQVTAVPVRQAQVSDEEEEAAPSPPRPSSHERPRSKSANEVTDTSSVVQAPSSHVISVSHF